MSYGWDDDLLSSIPLFGLEHARYEINDNFFSGDMCNFPLSRPMSRTYLSNSRYQSPKLNPHSRPPRNPSPQISQKIKGPRPLGPIFFMSIQRPSIIRPPGRITPSYPCTQRPSEPPSSKTSPSSSLLSPVASQIAKQIRVQPGNPP